MLTKSPLASPQIWPYVGLVLAILAVPARVEGSEPPLDLFRLSLEELLEMPVNTASWQASPWRKQPGIVTVFGADEMAAMGARTLLDVLQRIPGTSLGVDGRNSIGLMMRGNWTLEGKILVLINDLPVTELLYGSWSPLPYMPVSQLDRIEVLRGPGSTKYGGNAQLAVIRIYTRLPTDSANGDAELTLNDQHGTTTGILSINQTFASDSIQGVVSASRNDGAWGNEVWRDNLGVRARTRDAETDGSSIAISTNVGEQNALRLYHESYFINAIQGFGSAEPQGVIDLNRTFFGYSRSQPLAENLSLTPRLLYRRDRLRVEAPEEPTTFDIGSENLGIWFDLQWQYAASSSLNLGVEYQHESARANKTEGPFAPAPEQSYFGGSSTVDYERASLYADWLAPLGDYSLSIGARSSHHQYAGDAVTPRAALTRATESWHFKWLYGEAFREANIETIHYGTTVEPIAPERTVVHEVEIGHRLGDSGYLTAGVFDQQIHDPILFTQDQIDAFAYTNSVDLRTRGVDLSYVHRSANMSLQANYSWSRSNDDDLPVYDVEGRSGQFLGAAEHIANIWFSFKMSVDALVLNMGARYLSDRYAYRYDDRLAALPPYPISQQRLPTELTLNLALRYELDAIKISLGVDNLLNEMQYMPQPYVGVSTPFPYGSRSVWLRGQVEW